MFNVTILLFSVQRMGKWVMSWLGGERSEGKIYLFLHLTWADSRAHRLNRTVMATLSSYAHC